MKLQARGGFVVTPAERQELPILSTGTNRVVLDNTVPGGWRYEHTEAPATEPLR